MKRLSIVFVLAITVLAQPAKKAPAPQLIEPVQPVLAWIFPAGGQRGTTVEITASGTSIVPESVLVTGGGVSGKVLDGSVAARVKLSLTIAPDAAPGERELRILNAGGISNRFRFIVGELPEIREIEPNNEKTTAQKLPALPLVVDGQILDNDRDYFRFTAKAGETLVFSVQARSLLPFIADAVPGWFDPQLTVYDKSGKQVAFADDNRFLPDPAMFFKPPADGDYTLELRDIVYRGRGDFVYRMTMGALPFYTDVFPLGGRRGDEVAVEYRGVNLRETHGSVTVPAGAARTLTVHGLPFGASDYAAVREAEVNDAFERAQRLTAPVVVDGRVQKPGVSHYFVLTAKKDEKLVLEVQARRLGSPLDSVLTLFDAKRNQVAENDDWSDPLEAALAHNADSRILYTFPAAGDYYLRLRDIQQKGGEEYSFRLSVAPPHPDFTLRISPDNPRMGQGDTAAITVTAVRHDDFAGEIKLRVEKLPGGYLASEALIPAGQNEGRLTVTSPTGAPVGILSPVVTGMAMVGKDTVMHRAESAESLMQAFAYTHVLPTSQLFLAVIPGTGYTLSSNAPEGKVLEVKPESETPIVIKVLRKESVKAGVTITAVRLANNTITTKGVFVAPEKDEAEIVLTVSKDAKVGLRQDVIVSGLMRAGSQSIVRFARAIPIQVVAK
uniref:Peptidase domain protein n=1 Tax=Solibacter usitatus (strain Ellin6076) TaxID=234267 RepID=Q020D2_SOLUE